MGAFLHEQHQTKLPNRYHRMWNYCFDSKGITLYAPSVHVKGNVAHNKICRYYIGTFTDTHLERIDKEIITFINAKFCYICGGENSSYC